MGYVGDLLATAEGRIYVGRLISLQLTAFLLKFGF
jgi:hypothetical protein